MPEPAPKVDPNAATLFDAFVTKVSDHASASKPPPSPERYEAGPLLGRGGMGEVRLCRDSFIGREVAMKLISTSLKSHRDTPAITAARRARFIREAAVQGQLEHPAIVPVYDMGIGADDEVFFTMKCLRGETLADVVKSLRDGDEAMRVRFTRHRLLTIFAQVCRAIDFAHSRGVIHRDLKPSNVMLGAYGEVYVLDWGVAKVVGADDSRESSSATISVPDEAAAAATREGSMVGTLGYFSPEQARGEALDARSDVYSLGAILFELLAHEPMHALTSADAALASTLLDKAERRPSVRGVDDVPPEIDATCLRATSKNAADRHASAGELCADIERYLEGDRDEAMRRELATKHAETARVAADRAASGDEAARRDALREVGRALAFDPTNADAMRALVTILSTRPKNLPAEVARELEERERARRTHTARTIGIASIVGAAVLVGLLVATGIRRWEPAALLGALLCAAAGAGFIGAHRPSYRAYFVVDIALRMAAVWVLGALFGPFLILPSLFAMGGAVLGAMEDRIQRTFGLTLVVFTSLSLVALERANALPVHIHAIAGKLIIESDLLTFPENSTIACLAIAMLFLTVMPFVALGRQRGRLVDTEREGALREWHFRQLVPDASPQSIGRARSKQAPVEKHPSIGTA